jgi:hypothetical protein
MAYECILTERHGDGANGQLQTGLIRLNRPKQMNALNDQLMGTGPGAAGIRRRRGHRLHRGDRQ